MDSTTLTHLIDLMAKHLAPSASTLRYADVRGQTGALMRARRPDVAPLAIADNASLAAHPAASFDTVAAIGPLDDALLRGALHALREGGRLIVIDTHGAAGEALVRRLEDAGYIRILVEPASSGVLMRGEKPHASADTIARIEVASHRDIPQAGLAGFKGRFVHVPVRQTPNKPAWALRPDDVITWTGIAVVRGAGPALIVFSSLPNAVTFMQRAVLANRIVGVNKVAKFTREAAAEWATPLLINPLMTDVQHDTFGDFPLDPAQAVTGDE
ncbi:MAG: hypothetical protein KME04_04550 [Pleurocapsa minor GSE-CHR-MK-17-07R]|jgi:hypothetical protein|nr:hypothetical protein [Pleurocapsa minor GSE-CHR-MK 17-07R]